MAMLSKDQIDALMAEAEHPSIMETAIKLAMIGNRMYTNGDCCPLCGYDAYWDFDSTEQSAREAYRMLVQAEECAKENGWPA